jgi:hemoglobin-like flavoprotein
MALDADLLRSSLALVSEREDRITERFYDTLFTRYPQARPLFSRNRQEQAAMLQESIVAVLDHIEDAAWLESHLGELGRRHVDYAVTAEMYPWVIDSLVVTLAQIGGDDWTPEMDRAWRDALRAVSDLMLAGYPEGADGRSA